jgi:hypothetical protein
LLIVLCIAPSASALSSDNATSIVFEKDYRSEQLDYTTLANMALQGDLVNNQHTQVEIYYENEGNTPVVKMKKLLNKKVLSDGQVIETCSIAICGYDQFKKSEQEGSYTVALTIGCDYVTKLVENGRVTAYKATRFFATPTLIDSGRFRLTSLSGTIKERGPGYDAEGNPIKAKEDSALDTTSNPISGREYDENTGFDEYVWLQTGIVNGGYIEMLGTLKYQRVDTGTTYTFNLPYKVTSP